MTRSRPRSREAKLHVDWVNTLQPDGLVVSAAVLEEAGVYVKQGPEVQAAFREVTDGEVLPSLDALMGWLGWPERFVVRDHPWLRHELRALGEMVVADALLQSSDGDPLVIVSWCPGSMDERAQGGREWTATDQEMFERLLLDTNHPVGLHVSPTEIRLTYAPRGEAPGRLTFPVEALQTTDGAVLVDALQMLLGRAALFTRPRETQLRELLELSRKRQERVTVELAGQVEEALRILLAGFDAADRRVGGTLLREVSAEDLYDGLTTVLLRLVFLLYAEDRGLLPVDNEIYAESYALGSLAERLAAERVLYASAMDRRFGAWARLCTLFRLVYLGARHRDLRMPPREGDLFHPGRFPFLEGRSSESWHQDKLVAVPRVDDGVVDEVLERLLYLEGQRISYKNLEVEQIGSVYEALMGFEVVRAQRPSLHLRPDGVVVDLEGLRGADDPIRVVADTSGEKPAKVRSRVPELGAFAATDDADADVARLQVLLAPIAVRGAPRIERGQHALQPGLRRRHSASHYTPRRLTEGIVERTLAPLLFGHDGTEGPPTSDEILALKVCDPAMGSGAFLAEAARYLGKLLVEAWAREGASRPELADPETMARRTVVERCLYGVDKDARAVQLARLSMWLVTSASELPFTFVDHSLRCGDALVGLDVDQIAAFAFRGEGDHPLRRGLIEQSVRRAVDERLQIREISTDEMPLFPVDVQRQSAHKRKLHHLRSAQDDIARERRLADLLVACVVAGGGARQVATRQKHIGEFARRWYENSGRDLADEAVAVERELSDLRPFHWALEFPEVFSGNKPGFDAVIGNPPFGGKNNITAVNGPEAIRLLQEFWPHAHGASDYAAYFFLRARDLLRGGGTFGLVATNTISQGHTRSTGLRNLLEQNVSIYDATVDVTWPVRGAAVVVSFVHGIRGSWSGVVRRDETIVEAIASDLGAGEELPEPVKLRENANRSFQGSNVLGLGFVLTPQEANSLIERDARNAEVVKPYIGGSELNSNVPDDTGYIPHQRYVIAFGDRSLSQAAEWSELLAIVREKVKPERDALADNPDGRRRKKHWWQFGRLVPGLDRAIAPLERCLACSRVSKHLMLAFQPTDRILSEQTTVFAFDDWLHFAVLQSQLHEHWARSFASSMKTDMRYTPSRCFETFPFPRPTDPQRIALAEAGEALYALRNRVMIRDQQGMTQVWNRLVDPDCLDPDIVELRTRRDAMDRAVLAAYGWSDLDPTDRDDILTRLRRLNVERAAEEARST